MRNMLSHPTYWSDEDRHIMKFVVTPVLDSINEIVIQENIQERTNEMRNNIGNEISRALTER